MPKPLVSVVIPAYNCAEYVRTAIESVLAQSIGAGSIETIVLDDGSTDATQDAVRSYGSAVRFIQLSHGGVSRARNAGIDAAQAPYVAFLDADDYWFDRRLERALEILESDSRAIVNTDFFIEVAGERQPVPYYRSRGLRCLFDLDSQAQLDFALEDNFINCMVVAPRNALREAGCFNTSLRYGEDWDLWLRLLRAGYAVRLVPEPLAVYRYKRPGATTTRHDAGMARDRLYVLSQYGTAVSPYRLRQARATARALQLRQALNRIVHPGRPLA